MQLATNSSFELPGPPYTYQDQEFSQETSVLEPERVTEKQDSKCVISLFIPSKAPYRGHGGIVLSQPLA